jgi:ABC-type uncharacterized transport system substrate-binding protein
LQRINETFSEFVLPVQQATKFEFVINLNAAKQIGLTLSPEFLSRANQVIKESAGINRH